MSYSGRRDEGFVFKPDQADRRMFPRRYIYPVKAPKNALGQRAVGNYWVDFNYDCKQVNSGFTRLKWD